jgi:alkylation response protein AidB-like acyl-CoA dehydrogenase
MDFKFTEEQEKFRQEVRDFLEEEIRLGTFVPKPDVWMTAHSLEFTRKVAAKGWIGLNYPKEYGGQGRSWMDRLILTEEMVRYGAPTALHWFGDRQVGRSILAYGSEEQKRELLPKIIKGEASFALGMSEPEAGSDLASLKTRAKEDGDYFIIDGQKVWTTGRDRNYIYLIARTDPNVPKHKGLSEFVVDTTLPGVTIRPLVTIAGEEEFNEVFFDGVRVHKKWMLGEKNRGWYQIASQLDFERAGIERLMGNYPLFEAIIKFAKETKRDGKALSKESSIRERLAQLRIELDVGRMFAYWVATLMDKGHVPNWEAAMCKAYSTAFEKHLSSAAVEILGLYGQLVSDSKYVPIEGMAPHSYLVSKGYSLQGGTTEILKNIVAQRGLGLPRE